MMGGVGCDGGSGVGWGGVGEGGGGGRTGNAIKAELRQRRAFR